MEEIKGKFGNKAKVFADTFEDAAREQVLGLLNYEPYKNCNIRIMPDVHAGCGCTIGTTMDIHNVITPNLTGVDIGCLDCNTEVLTPNGWIKISKYNGEDIMQYNPETNKGIYKKPLLFIKKQCDSFYHFKNSKGLDQMVSEEHNMLVYYGSKNIKYYKKNPSYFNDVKGINKGYYRFNTCFNVENKGINLSDDLIRIDVMIQADGRIRKYDDYNFVELHFRKERKIQRAISLLEKANIKYNLSVWKDGTTNISFHVIKEIDKTLKKYWEANHNQLEIVAEECLLWDGYKGYRSSYSTTIKENADVIQYAFIATDIRASIYLSKNDRPNQNDCYMVIPTKNKYVGYNIKPAIEPSVDGFKYCFTTQEGYFVCRRNDYTFITGNCGMLVVKLNENSINLPRLDDIIHQRIPCGFSTHGEAIRCYNLSFLRCRDDINTDRVNKSIGTLGGGNHFIEVDYSEKEECYYLVIHTGSRNLGVQVCNYYQNLAVNSMNNNTDKQKLISELKSKGLEREINNELKKIKPIEFNKDLAHLTGTNFDDYINDVEITQDYASLNRHTIADIIISSMGFRVESEFETIHNYIDIFRMILRKGAVSAEFGEKLIIPMNMRDGSLICIGKGNADWNYSAPHGAGRLMSRTKAKETLSMGEFNDSMSGIYTTSINESTIDEAPQAYKPMNEIISCIKDTVDITDVIKPVYNFKAN